MNNEIVLLNSFEVANILRTSPTTARAIMKKRDFPLLRIGRNLMVEKGSFYRWLQSRHAV